MLEIYGPDGSIREYQLGPHTPRLRPQDLELLHTMWLRLTSDPKLAGTHHYHVVSLALEELQRELETDRRAELVNKLLDEVQPPRDDKN